MPDEVERLQRLAAQPNALSVFISPHGVIPRENGSPFYGARVPDLQIQYVDAKIMNQLSYHVLNRKFRDLGFSFTGSLARGVNDTLDLLRNARTGGIS